MSAYCGNASAAAPCWIRASFKDEGLHLVWLWNEVFLYDLRLQSITDTYNAISSDGVSLNATLVIRFRLQRDAVPVIHQSIERITCNCWRSPESAV
jgi:hypothetical protein